jgi:hypothetical protein
MLKRSQQPKFNSVKAKTRLSAGPYQRNTIREAKKMKEGKTLAASLLKSTLDIYLNSGNIVFAIFIQCGPYFS